MRVGVDTGGTFTDVVADDGRIAKVLSTRDDPSSAVAAAIVEVAAEGSLERLSHGTTVATNALLERRGAVVALVTNDGFTDVIEIARQDRPSLYDIFADRPEPLVARALRFGVTGRRSANGDELLAVGPAPAIPDEVESVAVCLLHADLSPDHERAIAEVLRERGLDVTCSHELSPEFREYERTVTTVINAYLRPPCRTYLQRLEPLAAEVLVMTSAGGLTSLDDAADRPAALLLSGPAGGVAAAAAASVAAGFPDCVTFDMGGTSTDVCLIRDGRPEPAAQRDVGGFPVRLPSLDVHTIGAGGGSIARIDAGGALRVGPGSAGAHPGPACYGRGGTEPTVTDANVVLGRIPAAASFPGLGALDRSAAASALSGAGVTADGVVAVVDEAMTQAVRAVTVERGVDPRQLALVAFGGAGPLHACAIAESLGMGAVIVPPRAGVLSAAGILAAARQVDLVRSWPDPGDHEGLGRALDELTDAALGLLNAGDGSGPASDLEAARSLDCRYRGQSHEITVPSVDAFHDEHASRNGYSRTEAPVEVVAVRVSLRETPSVALAELPAPGGRAPATGPAVLAEPDCTVWVADGWSAEVHASGSWILRRA
ncbi:MAG: hydantoinase/oxoprolinase family protein [Acidimicrobiales bacterium]